MNYEIDKKEWHICKICNSKIADLAKIHGGSGIYYKTVFLKHLEVDHKITPEEYFGPPLDCPCGICGKKCKITTTPKDPMKWKMPCGRYEGTMRWSENAKIERLGKNNPMYGKESWNKNKTAETDHRLKSVAEKNTGRKMSEESKKKMSDSAKKRLIHGHTGKKHTPENIEKFKKITAERISRGEFSKGMSKPHKELCLILNELNIEHNTEYLIEYYSFDIYIPKYNLLIEADGDYFHSNPKIYPSGPISKTQKRNWYNDIRKNKYCNQKGLILLRFWESDILNNKDFIKEKILCTLKELNQ